MKERKYVKKIIKMRENEARKGRCEGLQECCYRDIIEKEESINDIPDSNNTTGTKHLRLI